VARYLVVAHQTADSPALRGKVRELVSEPGAEFVVLTPVRQLTTLQLMAGERRTPLAIARWRTQRTRRRLEQAGARVVSVRIGGFDPLAAIDEELRSEHYDGVIISTLPPGLSHWVRRDLPAQVAARWPQTQVIHVVAPSSFYIEPAGRRPDVTRFPAQS
jgi:hypothetical protein